MVKARGQLCRKLLSDFISLTLKLVIKRHLSVAVGSSLCSPSKNTLVRLFLCVCLVDSHWFQQQPLPACHRPPTFCLGGQEGTSCCYELVRGPCRHSVGASSFAFAGQRPDPRPLWAVLDSYHQAGPKLLISFSTKPSEEALRKI